MQVLDLHLRVARNIVLIFLDFFEVVPKVKILLLLGRLMQSCVLGSFALTTVFNLYLDL